MDLVYLPSGGAPSATYNIPMPTPVTGSFVLIQFLDPVGKLNIYVLLNWHEIIVAIVQRNVTCFWIK